jgi:excisionase family DNA binding protein
MTSAANLPEPLADSVDTAAYRLGCGRAQLYKEIKAGRLKVRKLGRRTLVPRAEQEAWLAALPFHVPDVGRPFGDQRLGQLTADELRAVIERARAEERIGG